MHPSSCNTNKSAELPIMAAPAPVAVETTIPKSTEETPAIMTAPAAVFQLGKLAVEVIEVDHEEPRPPIPILIVSPKDAGTYPVAILLHGFFLRNSFYKGLLTHLASHGFIMVAPQFHLNLISTSDTDDIAAAAKVTAWLPASLPALLPAGVEPDLTKLALSGHSRGGQTAFSLALGHGDAATNEKLPFSALVELDPVAGKSKSWQLPPKILTYEPSSMELPGGIPVMVIGTGLGEEAKNFFCPPCAPKEVSHEEFYRECRAPCYHVVTKEYGHLDMLDDDTPALVTCLCKDGGGGCKEKMRRTVGGVMVAFFRAALHGEDGDLMAIVKKDPAGIAPTTLDPVECRLA